MLTTDEMNRMTSGILAGKRGPADVGLPDTLEYRKSWDAAAIDIKWIIDHGWVVDMIKE